MSISLWSQHPRAFALPGGSDMPYKPKRPCAYPGCPELADKRFCAAHQKISECARGSASERGYNHRWQRARERYLKEHPLCVECLKRSQYTPAVVVDHIIPHRGDETLFWNQNNWQPLCQKCHNKKTSTQDAGFGRGKVYSY